MYEWNNMYNPYNKGKGREWNVRRNRREERERER